MSSPAGNPKISSWQYFFMMIWLEDWELSFRISLIFQTHPTNTFSNISDLFKIKLVFSNFLLALCFLSQNRISNICFWLQNPFMHCVSVWNAAYILLFVILIILLAPGMWKFNRKISDLFLFSQPGENSKRRDPFTSWKQYPEEQIFSGIVH